jgi:hypothetical protein
LQTAVLAAAVVAGVAIYYSRRDYTRAT